ncbi:MAG: FHA domain-containing protein [Muribaculaceae bacterium]|nr:FHA domain-containing protein [Muribaculaceae bacterium]
MKLLKIGSGNTCNIVLHSPYVSALHAEMILMDNGDIFIEDKSTNGTFIGQQRLRPNVETKVQRGDLIKLGDVELPWNQVPVLKTRGFKSIYNIGSSMRNELQLTSQFASRYHATLYIDQQDKATLVDNGSRNGTEVNGTRIPKDRPVPIKRGDIVVCADEDITEMLKPLLPAGAAWLKPVGIGVAAVAVIAAGAFAAKSMLGGGEPEPAVQPVAVVDTMAPATSTPIQTAPSSAASMDDYRSGVVYVTAKYKLTFKFDPPVFTDAVWSQLYNEGNRGEIPLSESLNYGSQYSATAFFIDNEGRMATNRHVGAPWTSLDQATAQNALGVWGRAMTQIRKVRNANDYNYNENLTGDAGVIWKLILLQASQNGNASATALNGLIDQFKGAQPKLSGYIESIMVGFPGRNYTHIDEYDRCYVVKVASDEDTDLAILQMNTKKLPESVKHVFEVSSFYTEAIQPNQTELTWIGYPRGNNYNLDNSTLEPNIRQTKCSRNPTGRIFEFDSEVLGGASGSPVFDAKTGQLYGVIFGGRVGSTSYSAACQAKYLKKLYEDL